MITGGLLQRRRGLCDVLSQHGTLLLLCKGNTAGLFCEAGLVKLVLLWCTALALCLHAEALEGIVMQPPGSRPQEEGDGVITYTGADERPCSVPYDSFVVSILHHVSLQESLFFHVNAW